MDHFEDGFGRRHHVVSATKDPVEVLVLTRELTTAPGFEGALRERIEQCARFQHASFVRVRGLARLAKFDNAVALVSDRVTGARLSQLLEQGHALDTSGALLLTGQLFDALASLHQGVPGGWHGAVAPERLLLTPEGRLLVTEPVLGTAVRTLTWSTRESWERLRVATPRGGASTLDQRSDVAQAGAVALALLVGRPLGNGYPDRLGDTAPGAAPLSVRTAIDLLPDSVSTWLSRTLQLAGDQSYASIDEARLELAPILASLDDVAARRAVIAFVSGQRLPEARRSAPVPVVQPSRDPEPVRAPIANSTPVAFEPARDTADAGVSLPVSYSTEAGGAARALSAMRRALAPMTRRTVATAAAILMLLTTGGAFAAKRYFTPPATVETGTVAVTTNPAGANVVVDGQLRGQSPLTFTIASGDHVLQVGLDGSSRTVRVAVAPGAQVSQVIDLPKVVAPTGQLQIRTEPSGARVVVDGQKRGTSPLTVPDLMPGVHAVTVEGQLGSVTQEVTIESGGTASLVVPLTAPEGAPVSGWIAVTAPIDVQLFEKGQLLGSSRSERIMASVGRHDIEVVNDALGYRATRAVTVSAGQVSAVRVDPPKGSLSVNAVPWATVTIDGRDAGETPIGNVQLAIGTHDVVFRHPELGEQRSTVTVTLNGPARVSADLRRNP